MYLLIALNLDGCLWRLLYIRYRNLCTMHQLYHSSFNLLDPPIKLCLVLDIRIFTPLGVLLHLLTLKDAISHGHRHFFGIKEQSVE